MRLQVPGPTPLPPEVVEALTHPMISHRSDEFHELMRRVVTNVGQIIGTGNTILVLTTSGTGALEAAVANTIQPGDRVLSIRVGHFGQRFAQIAERFGAQLDRLTFEPGQAADPKVVAAAVSKLDYHAVLVTHCETSTGVLNDLQAISQALDAARQRPLLLVDGVSSLGATPLGLHDDEFDIVVTASQKAWMTPPGLAMLAVSERAWLATERCTSPRFYFDLAAAHSYARRGETPWTPAISLLYGLDAATKLILKEGAAQVFSRHAHLARRLREGLRDMGLQILASEHHASPTVTVARLPCGLESASLLQRLRERHMIVAADGQGSLKGKVFRIGHMGYVSQDDVEYLLDAVRDVLCSFGIGMV